MYLCDARSHSSFAHLVRTASTASRTFRFRLTNLLQRKIYNNTLVSIALPFLHDKLRSRATDSSTALKDGPANRYSQWLLQSAPTTMPG